MTLSGEDRGVGRPITIQVPAAVSGCMSLVEYRNPTPRQATRIFQVERPRLLDLFSTRSPQ